MRPLDDGSRDWMEPGIYSVAPGVYRVPLPMPGNGLRAVNAYVLADGDSLTLIDSGWALDDAEVRLESALAAIGASPSDIRRFLITHVHRDHYSLAVAMRREHGTPVALGSGERAALAAVSQPGRVPLADQLPLLGKAGAAPVVDALVAAFGSLPPQDWSLWERPDHWLTPGEIRTPGGRHLDVVHTPGHTAGHVVFDDSAEGLLFTGDHVLPHITPSVGLHAAPGPLPLRDYLASLRLLLSRPDRRVLPAHGPVSPSVHARVEELLCHHERRFDEIADLVAGGAHTAYDVARRLRWTRRERTLGDLDPFHQALAVLEVAAHLDVLAAREELLATDDAEGGREPVRRFTLA
ncbi:MBL fold metallo-hydrolase [Saccharomonospora xinjiangensis]|uniref:Zn-dependent hydrolase, glyoxylase n=1 Tax=Saccharomonospora xinjiangensis XJ-54 TaxID=882086 RepID=I0UZR3_9PSEU|nr:MBL fold metallo-hydrolase [Saccharomonospora xinjiangensis]EID53366.1 Zn-dependent hydrolase, glyoxylase [Saccharomonospora xinjiangensis XJ-54]